MSECEEHIEEQLFHEILRERVAGADSAHRKMKAQFVAEREERKKLEGELSRLQFANGVCAQEYERYKFFPDTDDIASRGRGVSASATQGPLAPSPRTP